MKLTINYTILSALFFAGLFSNCKAEKKPLTKCEMYELALNGKYKSPYLEGTMEFKGGLRGTVDISGVDFNDITCSYTILDCETGQADMSCDGAAHQEIILVINTDSIKVGINPYGRVR